MYMNYILQGTLYTVYIYKKFGFFLKINTCISHNQIFIGWTLIFQTQKNVPCTCINTHLSIRLYIFSLDISMGPSSSDPAASVSRYMSKHISNLCIWLDSTVSHDFEFINSSWWTFTSSSISCYSRKKKVISYNNLPSLQYCNRELFLVHVLTLMCLSFAAVLSCCQSTDTTNTGATFG